jgi:hypothetical protein
MSDETVTLPAKAWDELWAAMEASAVALGQTEVYAAHERIVDCWVAISKGDLATRIGAVCGHALKGNCESCR